MKKSTILLTFLIISCNNSLAQKKIYDSLVVLAKNALTQKKYDLSANHYMDAFKAIEGKAIASDRFNAAKACANSNKLDSAFSYLNRLWEKTDFLEIDSLEQNQYFSPLQKEERWAILIEKIKPTMPNLMFRLREIYVLDQKDRQKIGEAYRNKTTDSEEYKKFIIERNLIDSLNQMEVCAILDKYGWLGKKEVGNRGNSAIFLVIQHAVKVQEKYLPMMREAVKNGKAKPSNLAFLEDRVRMFKNQKQLYGSQFRTDKQGVTRMYPIEDIEHLNARRLEVGLRIFSESELLKFKEDEFYFKEF